MQFGVRTIYEARIEDLKQAHEREVAALKLTIDALAEQIEYLRMTGVPGPMRAAAPVADARSRQPMEAKNYMTEEEEDVRYMADNGLIDASDLAAALKELGVES